MADLAGVEIVFAQKLASGEPVTRQRALQALHEWINKNSQAKPFEYEDMMRLCKGFHYVMWMQDKMVLQEELADRISGLLTIFNSEIEKVLFIKAMLLCLSKEWHKVDRWRMDKFLMLMRRLIRVLFVHLRELGWKKHIRDPYWNLFKETTIAADRSFSEGLKFHFASIFLDELDNAGGLTRKQVTNCLKPFADLLSDKKISDYLFYSVIDETFMTILHQRSEELASHSEENMKSNVSFDYRALGKLLFDIGKQPHLTSARRRKIYAVVKKFEIAAAGSDPLHFETPKPKFVLKEKDYMEAEERIKMFDEKIKKENSSFKEEIKNLKRKANESLDGTSKKTRKDVIGDEIPKKTKKKTTKQSKVGKTRPKGLQRQNAIRRKSKKSS